MSYNSTTDFLALLRLTSGGVRTERMPGLDWFVVALARAGFFGLSVSATPPTTNQTVTAWFKPASPSWAFEGALFLWDAALGNYAPATPALWSNIFAAVTVPVVQDVTVAGPTNIATNATIVRVMNVGAPVSLVMPLSANKSGNVLVSDWANLAGANNISIARSGADVFPNGATSWTIAGDGGSLFFRPVQGGYVL